MNRIVLASAAFAMLASAASAQTANSSPTSGAGAGTGDTVRAAPSGGTARPDPGQPQAGAPTALDQHEEHKSRKDTDSVCKGC